MRLFRGVEIYKNLPVLYVKPISALVLADLHLGFEGIAAEKGIFIPKVQFKEEMEVLEKLLDSDAELVILNGDIKHEFSETSYHEFREVSELFDFLTKNFEKVLVVKGNHDNFIGIVARKFGIEVFDRLAIDNFFFAHGHRDFELPKNNYIVLAHEHPAIALVGEAGKEKVKAFLFGEAFGKKVVVLPALSTLASGSEINLLPKEALLSPFLKRVDIDSFKAVGIDEELGLLPFPELRKLRF